MSKRFTSFNSTEPLKKKSRNTFIPWSKIKTGFVPDAVRNGNVENALMYLVDLHTQNASNLPRIVMKHQLYSAMSSRTTVDRGVDKLKKNGDIKVFKTSLGTEQFCIMFTKDYIAYVTALHNLEKSSQPTEPMSKTLSRFLSEIVPIFRDVSIEESVLIGTHGFKDANVTELIKVGVLTVRDAGAWWLAIPDVGSFMKIFRKGRQSVIQIIRRTKYKEINCETLLSRKRPANLKLGFEYHVHDLVGADKVKSIETTTGILLRLVDD